MWRALHAAIFGAPKPAAIPEPAAPPIETAQARVVKAILAFREIVAAEDASQIPPAIESFKTIAWDLEPRELANEIEAAESMLTWLSFRDRATLGEAPPVVGRMSDGGPCYFRDAQVWLEQRRQDDLGQLDITDNGIFYDGVDKRLTLPWGKILTLESSGRSLIVHRGSGGAPHDFSCSHAGDAKRAHLIALTIWRRYQAAQADKPRRSPKKPKANASLSAQSSARPAWVPGPPKHAVRLSALPIGDTSHHDLGSGAGFSIGVVGESYRQAALHTLADGRLQRGEQVTFVAALIPEPDNPKDPHAIRVDIQGGPHIGYLSRDDATWYQPVFEVLTARHLIGVARAKLIGGVGAKPSIGVMLDLNPPTDLLALLTPVDSPF